MLPRLAFSETRAEVFTDYRQAGEQLDKALPRVNSLSPLDAPRVFSSKLVSIKIKDLVLNASSSTPVIAERCDVDSVDLIFPLVGKAFINNGSHSWTLVAQKQAILLNTDKRIWRDEGRSVVQTVLNSEKLSNVLQSITSDKNKSVQINETRSLPLTNHEIYFHDLFISLFSQIDSVQGNSIILERMGFDDSFYRLCVGLLHPEIFLTAEIPNGRRPSVRREINRLCEWMCENLTETISISDMERVSGLSARVLQYSFQKSFGMRPKQWLRKQRLQEVRDKLLDPSHHNKITEMSYEYCFASPSQFSQAYKQEFGEIPSHTKATVRPQY